QAFVRGEFERQHRTQRDRLAVQQPFREAATGLQGMTEGVTKIEERALTGFAFVARNDAGLGAAADRDRVLACRAAGKHILPILLKPGEKRRIAEQPEIGRAHVLTPVTLETS